MEAKFVVNIDYVEETGRFKCLGAPYDTCANVALTVLMFLMRVEVCDKSHQTRLNHFVLMY